MNYGLYTTDFLKTYGERYTPPYWIYTVIPRNYDQPLYYSHIDFAEAPYNELEWHYLVANGDILEVFLLQHRVLVVGVEIEIVSPADIVLRPVTRSGILFDAVDCSLGKKEIYTPFGGLLDRATDLQTHSFRVEEPDYFGFQILSGAANLSQLEIAVTLSVADEFSLDTFSNSTKDT